MSNFYGYEPNKSDINGVVKTDSSTSVEADRNMGNNKIRSRKDPTQDIDAAKCKFIKEN